LAENIFRESDYKEDVLLADITGGTEVVIEGWSDRGI